ncbi:hypothetical protein OAP41_03365 [Candidatus Poseidoniaceae archaeon]|nr:hypothetical protein [Candidatus Poseidoniaceae archaeon]
MRRRRKGKKDEGQSSLDAFTNTEPVPKKESVRVVPSMPDLDALTRADEKARQITEQAETSVPETEGSKPLRTFSMPSMQQHETFTAPEAEVIYHKLGEMYPHAPVIDSQHGLVLHRAVLNDITGCGQLMDWVADDHAVIVEMNRLMKKTVEFNSAIVRLNTFIDSDLGGQIIQMTETRLMLLPPGCRGVRGVDMEAFAVDAKELGRQGL